MASYPSRRNDCSAYLPSFMLDAKSVKLFRSNNINSSPFSLSSLSILKNAISPNFKLSTFSFIFFVVVVSVVSLIIFNCNKSISSFSLKSTLIRSILTNYFFLYFLALLFMKKSLYYFFINILLRIFLFFSLGNI